MSVDNVISADNEVDADNASSEVMWIAAIRISRRSRIWILVDFSLNRSCLV